MRRTSLILILFLLPCIAYSQNSAPNPSGTAIFMHALIAAGWNGVLPDSIVAVGSVKIGASESESVTVSGRGPSAIRFDSQSAEGARASIANGGRAGNSDGGEITELPPRYSLALQVPVFPFYFLSRFRHISVDFIGQEVIDGNLADIIEFSEPLFAPPLPTKQTTRLWVAHDSGLLLQISYSIPAITHGTAFAAHTRRFSNYKAVGSILFPMHQEEFRKGVKMLEYDFSDVQLNSISDASRFDIPKRKDQ